MPSYDPDPFAYLQNRLRRGGGPDYPRGIASLFVEIGNSHGGGRPSALGTEIWPSNVYQWTQAGAFQQMLGTGRYNLDQVPGGSYSTSTVLAPPNWDATHPPSTTYAQISPFLWFSQLYAAAHPEVALIAVVPHNKNATGFVDGSWTAAGAPSNLLGQAVTRANTAAAILTDLGYQVQWGGVAFHNADPDYDEGTNWGTHRQNIDGMVGYLRDSLNGFGNGPVLIGSGMTNDQLSALSTNDRNYQADLAQAQRRVAYTGVMDNINPRYGFSTGLPFTPMVDGIHEDYAGVQGLGTLRFQGFPRAALNVTPLTPFANFSFASALVGLYDFRRAARTDMSGQGNTLTQVANSSNAFPLHSFDSTFGEYIYRRTRSTTRGRNYKIPQALTTSYTKAWYGKFEDFTTSQGLFDDNEVTAAKRHRLAYAQSTDKIVANQANVAAAELTNAAATLGTTSYHLLVATYDSATTTMKLYVDGVLVSTASSAAIIPTTGGYIGSSDGDPSTTGSPMAASVLLVLNMNRAATQAEVTEMYTACLAAAV